MKYISTFELFEGYNKPRAGGKRRWSVKYKKKINCNNPKGFSQIQFCKRKKRGGHYKNESVEVLGTKSGSKDNSDFINVLRDISYEISDKDINVQIGHNIYGYIMVTIFSETNKYPDGLKFKYDDIKDPFLNMVDYMISEGFNIQEIVGYLHNNRFELVLEDDILFIETSDGDDDGGRFTDIGKLIIKFKQ